MTESIPSRPPADPIELQALRLLCSVCHVGRENAEDGTRTLWGEHRLQEVDHLLRHPTSLALLLIDHLRRRHDTLHQPALASQIRQLLRPQRSVPNRVVQSHRLAAAPWRSLDDPLAFLACRDLLSLSSRASSVTAGSFERGFTVTQDGLRAMAELTSRDGMGRNLRDRCRLLVTCLEGSPLDLEGAARRLDAYLQEEQIAVEEDPTPRLFYSLFGESL